MNQKDTKPNKNNQPKGNTVDKSRKPNRSKSKRTNVMFNLTNAEKKHKNFKYQNLTKAKCYTVDFTGSNFDCVSFRGASLKSCKFNGCSFDSSEFIGTNLKESNFFNAEFKNVVFDSAKLVDVDFRGSTFRNTIFLATDTSTVKNLNLDSEHITVYDEMPSLEMSDSLTAAIEKAMTNKFVKSARVLDTREGKINNLSIMILLKNFDEDTLIKGLSQLDEHIDRDFYALSFLIGLIERTTS